MADPPPKKNLQNLVIGQLVTVWFGQGVRHPNVENFWKLLSSKMGSSAFWHLKLYEKMQLNHEFLLWELYILAPKNELSNKRRLSPRDIRNIPTYYPPSPSYLPPPPLPYLYLSCLSPPPLPSP
jgi:hypothetical protein